MSISYLLAKLQTATKLTGLKQPSSILVNSSSGCSSSVGWACLSKVINWVDEAGWSWMTSSVCLSARAVRGPMFLTVQQARPGLVTWLHGLTGTRLEAVKFLKAKPLNWLDIASTRPSQVPGVGKETL